MARRIWIHSFALLAFVLSRWVVPSVAAAELSPPPLGIADWNHVVYEFQFVDITDEQHFRIGPGAIDVIVGVPDPRQDGVFRILTEPGILAAASRSSVQATLSAESGSASARRFAAPWIVAAPGRTASVRIGQERLTIVREAKAPSRAEAVHSATSGVDVRVTPLGFSASGRILTRLQLGAAGGPQSLDTEAELAAGEPYLAAVLEQRMETRRSGVLHIHEDRSRRYFAIYVRALPVGAPARDDLVAVAGTGGIDGLLWPLSAREPGGGTRLRVGLRAAADFVHVEAQSRVDKWLIRLSGRAVRQGPGGQRLAVERLLWSGAGEELFFGMHVVGGSGPAGTDLKTAAAFNETRTIGAVGLEAGFAPFVYSLAKSRFDEAQWWVGMSIDGKPALRLRYRSGEGQSLHAAARWRLSETGSFELAYDIDPLHGSGVLSFGWYWEFEARIGVP